MSKLTVAEAILRDSLMCLDVFHWCVWLEMFFFVGTKWPSQSTCPRSCLPADSSSSLISIDVFGRQCASIIDNIKVIDQHHGNLMLQTHYSNLHTKPHIWSAEAGASLCESASSPSFPTLGKGSVRLPTRWVDQVSCYHAIWKLHVFEIYTICPAIKHHHLPFMWSLCCTNVWSGFLLSFQVTHQ